VPQLSAHPLGATYLLGALNNRFRESFHLMNYFNKHFVLFSFPTSVAILSFSILLVLLCQSSLFAFEPKDNRFISETKEILLKDSSGAKISQVLFVLKKSYDEVCQKVKLWADTTIGSQLEKRRIIVEYMDFDKTLYFLSFDSLRRAKAYMDFETDKFLLNHMGVCLDSVVEYKIFTKPYNKVEQVGGYSQLQITLYDGAKILGHNCTLMTMFRTDNWLDWAVLGRTGIPLPFKLETNDVNITETELHFARAIYMSLNTSVMQYFVTKNVLMPLMDVDLMRKIKKLVIRKD
jgi:hypothetical protein